jgi:hypothetical protein
MVVKRPRALPEAVIRQRDTRNSGLRRKSAELPAGWPGNFATDGRTRPAETRVRTAVPGGLPIRTRSQVQVLAGRPPATTSGNAARRHAGCRFGRRASGTPRNWGNCLRRTDGLRLVSLLASGWTRVHSSVSNPNASGPLRSAWLTASSSAWDSRGRRPAGGAQRRVTTLVLSEVPGDGGLRRDPEGAGDLGLPGAVGDRWAASGHRCSRPARSCRQNPP